MGSGYIDIPGAGFPTWKAPVTTASALPNSGNGLGDARVTQDMGFVYVWNGSSWINNGGAGTVTSVAMTVPSFLSVSGSPITGAGTFGVTLSGTALPVTSGGTGDTSLTAYSVLCGGTTSTGAVQSVASVGTLGQVLTSNGAVALPTFQTLPTQFNVVPISTTTSAVSGKNYLADTSGGGFTVTLPAHVINQYVSIKDSTGSFNTNNLTVARNGGTGKIEGVSASYVITSNWSNTVFFDNGTDWFIY